MFKCCKLARGNPHHPPLIFLHGFLGAKEDWEEWFSYFENDFHCIALDLPGHGSTPDCDHIVQAVKGELESLPRKPILIGYSMGGRIALQLQGCASGMVIMSAHLGLKTQQEKEERRQVDEEWVEKMIHSPWEKFVTAWYHQPIFQTLQRNPVLLQRLIAKRAKQNPTSLVSVLRQLSLANQPYTFQFVCPTLFLFGEEDWKYREFYGTLPNTVTVRGIKNCGHALHLENGAECSHVILNWLNNANP